MVDMFVKNDFCLILMFFRTIKTQLINLFLIGLNLLFEPIHVYSMDYI